MAVRRLVVVAGILALAGPLEAQVRTSAFPLQRLSVSVLDATATERTCGRSRAVFTVTLSRLSWRPVVVQYATGDGTALAGSDYTGVSGALTLNPWTLSASVTVPVTADQETEPNETFFLRLTGDSVRIADGEAVATIRNNRCDDADPCTFDRNTCSRLQDCRHVDVAACGGAACELGACELDTDGDGFSDAWEDNDYIDIDCNGVQDATDFAFPHEFFSPVARTGTGTGILSPTPTNPAAAVTVSTIVATISVGGQLGAAAFTYTLDGGAAIGPLASSQAIDVAGNIRLIFNNGAVNPGFVAGDSYTFSAGTDTKVADKTRPNVYLQYDYMDFATPTATACATAADCGAAGLTNFVCDAGFCNHNHLPADPTFQKVVDSYRLHNAILYIDPVHNAVPHATVVTFSLPTDPNDGAKVPCAGADVVAGNIGPGQAAVNFHDIKKRLTFGGPFDVKRKNVFHYAVFGHMNTCTTDVGAVGNCNNCPPDRSTPPGIPPVGSSGLAELPGNDFIVSLGTGFYDTASAPARTIFNEGATFMHELGHNIGLHHAGDVPTPERKPNYLSVMNARYSLTGISTSNVAGGTPPVANAALRRLDYSARILPTFAPSSLNEASLDENVGVAPAGSGFKDILRFRTLSGSLGAGAEEGPINWSGNDFDIDGNPNNDNPVSVDLNEDEGGAGPGTSVHPGFSDWNHGACVTTTDCAVNQIRTAIAGVATKEPCVGGQCVSFIYPFQCFAWGIADSPAPAEFQVKGSEPTVAAAKKFHELYEPLAASIEVWARPRDANAADGPGEVAVALLGSTALDVAEVDLASLRLAGARPFRTVVRDADGDRRLDLVMAFDRAGLRLAPSASTLTLTGWLRSSQAFIARGSLVPGPSQGGPR